MIKKTSKPNDNGAKYSLDSNHKNENPVWTNQQLEKYTHKEFWQDMIEFENQWTQNGENVINVKTIM